jgi:hypothetical protein
VNITLEAKQRRIEESWHKVLLQLDGCQEFRLSQHPYDNVVVIEARLQLLDGDWWVIFDAEYWTRDVIPASEIRERATHYLRGGSLSYAVAPLDG